MGVRRGMSPNLQPEDTIISRGVPTVLIKVWLTLTATRVPFADARLAPAPYLNKGESARGCLSMKPFCGRQLSSKNLSVALLCENLAWHP
jgi:hypothetical protein